MNVVRARTGNPDSSPSALCACHPEPEFANQPLFPAAVYRPSVNASNLGRRVLDTRVALPADTLLDAAYRIKRVVGAGGFGITYEALDVGLGIQVALKEYYPDEFADRDANMCVHPNSDRHKDIFDWGRANFLKEARTLAQFEHPSIVRVTRVFEANATAYMVMGFEQGQNFEAWLKNLGRPPNQQELDAIAVPLLSALETMHASDFLHRDIAPDNIVIRSDGAPVLLDFGAARRAVAERTRMMTGIVKVGYSPHEQYSANSRLQGPWSDVYALGATLYRAVVGQPPEEATLRVGEDRMVPAALAAKGTYRPGFLAAIDACLRVRQTDRPQSIGQLRPILLGTRAQQRHANPREAIGAGVLATPRVGHPTRLWWAVTGIALLVSAGAYGLYAWASADLRWDDLRRREPVVSTRPRVGSSSATEAGKSPGRIVKLTSMVGQRLNDPHKAWLGVNAETLELPLARALGLDNADGVILLATAEGGPASQAELRFGDILVAINGVRITNLKDLREQVTTLTSGSEAVLEVWRSTADGGDFLETLRRLARGGNAHVMYELGRIYSGGKGVPRDDALAMQWFRQGTNGGSARAMTALAIALMDGRGKASDQLEPLRLLQTAAASNDTEAMFRLAHLFLEGRLVEKDTSKAIGLFAAAAEAGHAPSMFELGRMYYSGNGVPADLSTALNWYRRSADLGNAASMVNLGWLYEHGRGVEMDIAQALALYRRAADLGNSIGMVNLAVLYAEGKGVERNEAAAVSLYQKAMGLGNAMAMYNFAWMLQSGRGVTHKDADGAADLILKALDRHSETARQRLIQTVSSWSPEFRRALQTRLRNGGYYAGQTDGDSREPTIAAINAYFNRSR
jgi:TPR repeat protein